MLFFQNFNKGFFLCCDMEKVKVNYWVDVLLIILFVIVGISGIVLDFAFTSGVPNIGRTITFLGTHKLDWLRPHAIAGLAMVVLLIIHLVLHFKWLGLMTRRLVDNNSASIKKKH